MLPITPKIISAYAHCPRKAYLLLDGKIGKKHEYETIIKKKKEETQKTYISKLIEQGLVIESFEVNGLKSKADILTDVSIQSDNYIVEDILLSKSKKEPKVFEPIMFIGTHKVSKQNKLSLHFAGQVISKHTKKQPSSGKIITAELKTRNLKFNNSEKELFYTIEPIKDWLEKPEEPPAYLNKHCQECEFNKACRKIAEQEDNLSLIGLTPKEIRKYERKGIFTVKQLAFTYKPRKRKKRSKNPPPLIHKPELRALAIRDKKIYVQELPEIERKPVEIFLDIEGVPDEGFYYLIGLLVCEGEKNEYHSFWADNKAEEEEMWCKCFNFLSQYHDTQIYHYGTYDARALKTLMQRYTTEDSDLINQLSNVTKYIYAKIYFPIYSNSLKVLGKFLHFHFSNELSSGLYSLVWQKLWQETQNVKYSSYLNSYNKEDCILLKLLLDKITQLNDLAIFVNDIDLVQEGYSDSHKSLHNQFDSILKFAHSDYDKKKIHFQDITKNPKESSSSTTNPQKTKKMPNSGVPSFPKPNKHVILPLRKFCPKHHNHNLVGTKEFINITTLDLVLGSTGIKRVVVKFSNEKGYCKKCRSKYRHPEFPKAFRHYGHGLRAWFVYQRIALRLPFARIEELFSAQFGTHAPRNSSSLFIRSFVIYYQTTLETIFQKLLKSDFIHLDETTLNVRGHNQYVWTFTNDQYVYFILKKDRTVEEIKMMLSNFKGTIITDFYPGYDSFDCIQQKCWVHLIRDLNNDLHKNPFDQEYEGFVLAIKNLIIPIMKNIQQNGIRTYRLRKYKKDVEKFYFKTINQSYHSDIVRKYQSRFKRYKESLFTFLEQNNLPWHNNTAELALRHITVQEKISGSLFEQGAHDYVAMLSIQQTCRFQGKSFFKFLFSKETNLDNFQKSKTPKQPKGTLS